ncbi:MAG: hypothetical protein R3E53_09940 [Myxococcota bacterium]
MLRAAVVEMRRERARRVEELLIGQPVLAVLEGHAVPERARRHLEDHHQVHAKPALASNNDPLAKEDPISPTTAAASLP